MSLFSPILQKDYLIYFRQKNYATNNKIYGHFHISLRQNANYHFNYTHPFNAAWRIYKSRKSHSIIKIFQKYEYYNYTILWIYWICNIFIVIHIIVSIADLDDTLNNSSSHIKIKILIHKLHDNVALCTLCFNAQYCTAYLPYNLHALG